MKIAIIGCGKRFVNVYASILKKLDHELLIWNRTRSKTEKFIELNGGKSYESIGEMLGQDPDLVLCFVPDRHQHEILESIDALKCPILLETPAVDQRILTSRHATKIGMLEQWPYLPLEQFKEKIYSDGLISRPYLAFNDGRSFDYHAMAQLRTYLGRPMPLSAKGFVKAYSNPGIIDSSGNTNTNLHEWTVGQIDMSNGSLINYSFSYTCKSHLTIPVQLLRSLSTDGSVTTGRMTQMGNDYEIVDVRYIDRSKTPHVSHIQSKKVGSTVTSLSLDAGEKQLSWKNPYVNLEFDDQQTAIASLLKEAASGNLYSFRESFIDNACINMIKQSAYTGQTVRLGS